MNCEKHIGLDVHQATISVAVTDSKATVMMESILETKASTVLEFFAATRHFGGHFGRRNLGRVVVRSTKPHVGRVVVCNPRKNAPLKHGNKNDHIDARKLANLLHLDELEPVYHGQTGCVRWVNWRGVI